MQPMRNSSNRSHHSPAGLLIWILSLPILLYRTIISPMFRPHCRFHPTCSRYALTALDRHGPLKGVGYSLWRVIRCGPWSRGGFDPVPDSKDNR